MKSAWSFTRTTKKSLGSEWTLSSLEPQNTRSSTPPTLPGVSSEKKRRVPISTQKRWPYAKGRLPKTYIASNSLSQNCAGAHSSRGVFPRKKPNPSAISFIWPTLMNLKSKAHQTESQVHPVDESDRPSKRPFNDARWTKLDWDLFRASSDSPDSLSPGRSKTPVLGILSSSPGRRIDYSEPRYPFTTSTSSRVESATISDSKRRIDCGEAIPSPATSTSSSPARVASVETSISETELSMEQSMELSCIKETEVKIDGTKSSQGSKSAGPGSQRGCSNTPPKISRELPSNSFTKDSTVPLAPSVSEDQVGGTVPASLHVHAEHHHKDVEGSMAKDPGVRKDEELPSTATVSKSERTNEHSSMPKSQTKDYSEPDKRDMITTYSRMSDSELNLTSFTVENQATIYNYFIMYDYDGSGCVSMNELISLFNAMDRLPKEQAFLDHIMSSVDANADGELKFDEFMPFLQAFYSTVYKQAFMDHCVTKESVAKLPKKNLRQALHQIQRAGFALRYEEFELVMEKAEAILDEVPLENLAKKSSGAYGFTFEQFHQVLQFFRQLEFDQLRQSAGFNPERIAEVEALFYEADTDNSGCLDIGEVFQSFQGAQLPITDVDNFVDLFARMDIDKSASLSLPELLRLMSIYSKILAEKGQSSSPKSIRPHHATRCLDQSRVWRLKENAKQLALKVEEVFDRGPSASDMVNIAIIEESEHVLLAKEYGLSVQDMRSLRESFEICDVDGSGTIDKGELKGLLRNLGFPPNTAFQNQVLDSCLANFEKDCNKDDNGLVFQRCVQWILKYFMALAYAAFESFRQGDMIPRDTINLALYQLGQYHAKQSFIDFQQEQGLEEKADLDFETFAALVSFLRAQRLEQWRKTYGFSCTELEQYREQFNITCGDSKNSAGKQILELTRIETLLESLGYMHDPRNQGNTMLQAFARVDQEGTGMLTFEDFVRLLRHLENNRTLVKKQEEDQVIKAFGLDSDAVNLLHECFNSCPKSHQGHVSQQDIKIMLSKQKIIKTQDQRKQLSIVLEAVCPGEESTVSFANFLRILRSLEQGIY